MTDCWKLLEKLEHEWFTLESEYQYENFIMKSSFVEIRKIIESSLTPEEKLEEIEEIMDYDSETVDYYMMPMVVE